MFLDYLLALLLARVFETSPQPLAESDDERADAMLRKGAGIEYEGPTT